MIQQRKIKSLGNNDDRADQKTEQNNDNDNDNDNDNALGIPGANLELKHMFILCS